MPGYDLILTDGPGGILVTKVLEAVINRARQEEGLPPCTLPDHPYSIAGEGSDPNRIEAIRGYLADIVAENKGKKILLVTEHMESGGTMYQLAKRLHELGAEFDIAAVSMRHHSYWGGDPELEERILYGSIGVDGTRIRGERGHVYSGQEKPPPHTSRALTVDAGHRDEEKISRAHGAALEFALCLYGVIA